MGQLGVPEMIMILIIAILAIGPRSLPHLSEVIQGVRRAVNNDEYPLPLVLAFALFLIVAFIYGVVSTMDLFH